MQCPSSICRPFSVRSLLVICRRVPHVLLPRYFAFFQMLTLENACFPMGCTSAPRLHGIKRQWAIQFYPITRTKHIIAWFAQAKHAGVGDIRCANSARLVNAGCCDGLFNGAAEG